ncbi:hypothetical protein DPMN_001216 [Dreissena polymorpha]|uniref:Uncharacterized protein n=1 Tax=Dreissena polymorpha TaxID=45954 RepID=A0A9D4MI37_DREPO|nr:hypothetical protein DPMN_001216 [Dreissena polymorpha]
MQSSTTITTMFPVTTSAVSIHAHSTSVYVESSSPSPTSVNPTTNAMPPTTEVTTLMTAMPSLTTSANIFPVTTSVTPTQDRSASVYIEPSTYAGSVDPTTNAVPPTTSVTTSMTAMPSLTTPRHPEMLYIMPCICYPNKTFAGMTQEQIIQHLIAQTKINLKETHAAKNRLISRSDTRASSRMIGIVGTIVLVLVFGTVVLFDAISLWQKWCCFRKASFRVSDNP